MYVVSDLATLQRGEPTILTIGAFDGVHRGHQYLIGQVQERARQLGYQSMVLTFSPRPQVVLRPGSLQLTDGAAKERLIGALNPDLLAILAFTPELATVPAEQFLQAILDHVNLAEIWVGADFAFGHKRGGNVDFLIRSGQEFGFGVMVVPRIQLDGMPISSTVIRHLLRDGRLPEATALLGHYFGFAGPVVNGFGRGRKLGFPTANIAPPPFQFLPATGIYAAYLHLDQWTKPAAVSIGYNPVFGGQEVVTEAYVLDFAGELRGRTVRLDLVDRIREERNFDGIEALVSEMQRDVEKVRGRLGAT